jgi:twitching motility protein PilT
VLDLEELLRYAVSREASDIHLKVGSAPVVRIDGRLERTDHPPITPAETERIAFAIMPKQRAEEFLSTCEADFAHSVAGLGRFRVNVMRQRGSVGLVMRRVQSAILSFEDLGLPPAVRRLAENPRGLVLVTGPTGSGKTTTLAAMIDHINETMSRHIVTIEDPIEVLHGDKQSVVNQREIGTDTADFHSALKRVLRQDPDVILIGEMRDPETVKTALSAAETGHLVFSTLHTISATETINRIIDFFPPHEQRQVRMAVAGALRGIVSQRLVECRDGAGRVPAVEVLVATGRVFDKIVNADETHEIDEIISDGEYYGMQSFDQALLALYQRGAIDLREALAASSRPHDLRLMIEQHTLAQAEQ